MAEPKRGYRAVLSIPLEDIEVRENIRLTYDENEMVELITSMKQQGQLQPVGVMKSSDPESQQEWELVFGNRRFAAARKLGWETIDAVVIEVREKTNKRIINAIENLQRVDVSLIEQGRVYSEMVEKDGYSIAELAAVLAKSSGFVKSAIDIFKRVPKQFRDKVVHVTPGMRSSELEGKLAGGNARKVLQLADTYSLNRNETAQLFEGIEKGLKKDDLRVVAKLLAQGIELNDAMGMATEVKVVHYTCIMPLKNVELIQQETGESIVAYIDSLLIKDKQLNLIPIQRNRGRALPLQKTEKKGDDEEANGNGVTNKGPKVWTRKKQPKQETLELGAE